LKPAIALFFIATALCAQGWMQWGADAQHQSAISVAGRRLARIEAEMVLDPFADIAEANAGGNLLAHYAVPLVDGSDLYAVVKSGAFVSAPGRDAQIWNVVNVRLVNGQLMTRWSYESDWKPVPYGGGATWEPVYHPALTADAVWAPGAGGMIDKIDRNTGVRIARFNPFGVTVDHSIFVTGPPTVSAAGDVYYNAMQLGASEPWSNDSLDAWLVRIAADGKMSRATFASLMPNAPLANALCTTSFDTSLLPFPPSRNAVAPVTRCGPQRPGINVAPAVAPDGTVYTISRAHLNDRWGFLVAANRDLTPKWTASLRNRFQDGCNVTIPPNGTPGGCRADAITGVDPDDNQSGSGRVIDLSTSSPVVTPDGRILYGSYTRYNYSQGHLMMFTADGIYLGAYGWGWDLTPGIYRHGGTYSIVLKENHYSVGSYCNDLNICPRDRTMNAPADPESFFMTQLDPALRPEWKFQNKNTQSCERMPDGTLNCVDDHPEGFEWCVNAVAIDRDGVVYANSEDGNLYAIAQGGAVASRIFLRLALGAAYTPTSIGSDGRIYTQNDGALFIITDVVRRRAVRLR
jgi:outer membrane protein assembly factor BamB